MSNLALANRHKADAAHRGMHRIPPPHVLDRDAERRLTGGYNLSRKNRCGSCYVALPVNGACGCRD